MAIDQHQFLRDNIDAWALGALDADETRALDAHVDTCDACAVLADAARETAAAIALTVPFVAAPLELRARVMAPATVLREMPAPAIALATAPRPRRSWWAQGAAAAVVVLGISMITWGAIMQQRLGDVRADNGDLVVAATSQTSQFSTVRAEVSMASAKNNALASQQDAVFDLVSQPDVRRAQLTGTTAMPSATGRYMWSTATDLGVLVARDLPVLEDGKRYCLWFVYDNAWTLGGLFDADETGTGRLIVREAEAPAAADVFRGFAVTVESVSPQGVQSHNGTTLLRATID